MKRLSTLFSVILVLHTASAVAADGVDAGAQQQAGSDNTASGCVQKHSRALCIAKAGGIAGAMKDATPAEVKPLLENKTGEVLWYAGAATGSATVFRQAKGLSKGTEVGLLLVGMLASAASSSDLLGRNLVLAWMPTSLASSREDANEKAQSILMEATMASFAGSTITLESSSATKDNEPYSLSKPDQIRYRISGAKCEGHDCFLVPQMKSYGGGGLLGTRSFPKKAPEVLGGGDSYQFTSRLGAIYPLALIVDGKLQTHTYMQELSRHLPSWMYTAVSPETKASGGVLFNEGQKTPVLFNQGKAMYFAFPEVLQQETATVSSN